MLQFGFRPLEQVHVIEDVSYTHILVYLGLGSQYGVGECIVPQEMAQIILQKERLLQQQFMRYVFNGPERFWHFLHHLIPNDNEIIRAIDMASWDLWGKVSGKSVHHLITDVKFSDADFPGPVLDIENLLNFKNQDEIQQVDFRHIEGVVLEEIPTEDFMNSIVDSKSDVTFYSKNVEILKDFAQVKPLINFEETQGISDLIVHENKYSFKDCLICTHSGSLLTITMLSAINSGKIAARKTLKSNTSMYKNLHINDSGILEYTDKSFHGHGVLV